jgi:putative transcriptional regulator
VNTGEKKYLVKLGVHIRTLREAKGIDQKQFAFECGISRTQLYTIEKGETNPRAITLMRIAKGLDISTAKMLDF